MLFNHTRSISAKLTLPEKYKYRNIPITKKNVSKLVTEQSQYRSNDHYNKQWYTLESNYRKISNATERHCEECFTEKAFDVGDHAFSSTMLYKRMNKESVQGYEKNNAQCDLTKIMS